MNCALTILAIESSCDDTSAAVMRDGVLLSNVTASQAVHEAYGGVVPELASRAHQQNIVPVVHAALQRAGVATSDLSAIAFTRGPGLMGSLLVGVSFAKGLAASLRLPMVEVNHLQGHILAHFITTPLAAGEQPREVPTFPFLCLLVSGGNSQIVLVHDPYRMEVVGQTIDDAAGEAIDKCAKVMGLGYPGGPIIDRLARTGDPHAFSFAHPRVSGYDYSFSGLKTSFLYQLRQAVQTDPQFVESHKADLAASVEHAVVSTLMDSLARAAHDLGITTIAVAGGVSANTGLRQALIAYGEQTGAKVFIPPFAYTTDNAAMIAMAAHFKCQRQDYCPINLPAFARMTT